MYAALENVRNEMIDEAGEKAEKFGLPRVAGQLQGLLLLHKGALSLDEMAARLEVSKASISTNIRILERWKVARRVYNRGERKNYYEMNGTLWDIETEIVSTVVDEELDRFRRIIDRNNDFLKASKPKNSHERDDLKFIQSRFDEIKDYLEAADYFLKQLTKKGKITPALIKRIKIT
jgi:DNA-binding transcriptional regulator GbsR (MarR family)